MGKTSSCGLVLFMSGRRLVQQALQPCPPLLDGPERQGRQGVVGFSTGTATVRSPQGASPTAIKPRVLDLRRLADDALCSTSEEAMFSPPQMSLSLLRSKTLGFDGPAAQSSDKMPPGVQCAKGGLGASDRNRPKHSWRREQQKAAVRGLPGQAHD